MVQSNWRLQLRCVVPCCATSGLLFDCRHGEGFLGLSLQDAVLGPDALTLCRGLTWSFDCESYQSKDVVVEIQTYSQLVVG